MTINERIHKMLVRLKLSDGHPAWHTPNMAVTYIAERLRIVKQFSGPVCIDEETVAKLEAAMPKPKAKKPSAALTRKELAVLRLIVEVHRESEYESNGVGVEMADNILAKIGATVQAATPQVKPLTWALWWFQDQGHREYAVAPYGMEYHVSDEGWWFPLFKLNPCDGIEAAKAAAYAYHAKVVQECIT